jgi:hypothetical protein
MRQSSYGDDLPQLLNSPLPAKIKLRTALPGRSEGVDALLENSATGRMRKTETVMIELTEQQRQELSVPEPVARDPQTGQTYILVRRETYERLRAILALEDYDPEEGAGYINEVMADDDAKDPYLESYQHYGKQA